MLKDNDKNRKLKKSIYDSAIQGLQEFCNIEEEIAIKMYKDSKIDSYIDKSPDTWSHMNQEQIVYEIIR